MPTQISTLLVRHWLSATIVLLCGVAAFHLGFGMEGDGFSFLYIIPVCVAAVGGGRAMGVATASTATLLVLAWAELRHIAVPETGYAIRFFAFLVVGLYVANLELDRRRLLDRVHAMAHTDVLTGLPNRRAWDDELRSALARAQRSGVPVTVGLLDLDHFKRYNDKHGHSGGDRLLRSAAGAWSGAMRQSDFLARYGGEEFGFILWGCDPSAAQGLAERFRQATPDGATCSVGFAIWDGQESPDAIVARADTALYRAKADGRDRVCCALSVVSTPPPWQTRAHRHAV